MVDATEKSSAVQEAAGRNGSNGAGGGPGRRRSGDVWATPVPEKRVRKAGLNDSAKWHRPQSVLVGSKRKRQGTAWHPPLRPLGVGSWHWQERMADVRRQNMLLGRFRMGSKSRGSKIGQRNERLR